MIRSYGNGEGGGRSGRSRRHKGGDKWRRRPVGRKWWRAGGWQREGGKF